mgnify:CR=1 FL=1
MAGNTFGQLFRITTAGESHGPGNVVIIDGVPPGIPLTESDFELDLSRRRPGQSRIVTQRNESDTPEILSGVFNGETTGTSLAILIRNEDQRSRDYGDIAEKYRPGHADFGFDAKYGRRDYRGGGRSSARETAVRVAAAAIAKKWLAERHGVTIRGCLEQMGEIFCARLDWSIVNQNPFFSADPGQIAALETAVTALREQGDSVGARLYVEATGVPPGWGEPVFDRLDADIAHALMSINAVKGVEIGDGMAVAALRGTEHRDEMTPEGFASNHSGGIAGGISTGQTVYARYAIKPTSSITTPGRSINSAGEAVEMRTTGRHDPCVGLRATPIGEAMLALVLMDHALRHRAQNTDVHPTTPRLPPEILP